MRYQDKTFTVPASGGSPQYCATHGHTMPDAKGKCLRCSAKLRHAVCNQSCSAHGIDPVRCVEHGCQLTEANA